MTSLAALQGCVKNKDAFRLIFNPETKGIHYTKLSTRQKTDWGENSVVLMQFLEHLPMARSPAEAMKSEIILAAKEVLKIVTAKVENNSIIKKCDNLMLAHRLAISVDVVEKNHEFAEFAKKTYLYNYLAAYGDKLTFDEHTGEPIIKYKKKFVKWSEVPEKIKQFQARNPDKPYEPWKYGPNGLRDKNFYDFKELKKVFVRDPAAWGNRFLVGMCTSCVDKPRTTAGDHSWIRLYDGETGKIYSVGLYRPDKRFEKTPSKDCLRMKPGFLMTDFSEFWGAQIQEIRVKISKEDFLRMKALIEEDKTKEITGKNSLEKLKDALTFQLMGTNCTAYVGKVTQVAKINLPDKMPFLTVWFYSKFYSATMVRVISRIKSVIPSWVLMINTIATTFFSNLIGLRFGTRVVDPKLAAVADVEPPFKRWQQLFDRNLAENRSPFVLGQITRVKIENWRAAESKKLNDRLSQANEAQKKELMQQIDDLQYQLPPEDFWKESA